MDFAAAALVGLLVGRVICSPLPLLRRALLLIGVLLACSVAMVLVGMTAASPPRFAPVQFVVTLLGASPVVAAASIAALLAKHLRASRFATLATAATVGAVSWAPGILVLFGAVCWLAGDCL